MAGSSAHDAHPTAALADALLPRPAAAVFDGADVLYDASIWSRWLVQQLHRLGLHTHYQPFVHVLEHDYLIQAYRGVCPYWRAIGDFLRSVGLSHGQVDEVLVAAQGAQRRFSQSLRPFPGVRRTLRSLGEAGLPMAVLCNSEQSAEQVAATLHRLGLREDLAVVLSSLDLGMALPEPGAYQAAAESLGHSVEHVVYIGHDGCELAGAAAVGMPTLAFNASGCVAADAHIDRFEQLLLLAGPLRARMTAG
ncbi:MAG: HAD family hydrolase [Pirellulaceae bacterium]